jgi:hypothetical protein
VWLTQVLQKPSDIIESSCLRMRLALIDLYADVELPPLGVAEEEAADYAALATA